MPGPRRRVQSDVNHDPWKGSRQLRGRGAIFSAPLPQSQRRRLPPLLSLGGAFEGAPAESLTLLSAVRVLAALAARFARFLRVIGKIARAAALPAAFRSFLL
jgi:hypothetical protein